MKQPVDKEKFIINRVKTESYFGRVFGNKLKKNSQLFNLHHEVIDVHGPGSLLTELSLLQNTLNLLADAEVCWDFLSRRSTRF